MKVESAVALIGGISRYEEFRRRKMIKLKSNFNIIIGSHGQAICLPGFFLSSLLVQSRDSLGAPLR